MDNFNDEPDGMDIFNDEPDGMDIFNDEPDGMDNNCEIKSFPISVRWFT